MKIEGPVEITGDLALDEAETQLLDVHSVVNILTVVILEIEVIGDLVEDPGAAVRLADLAIDWSTRMTGGEQTVSELRRAPEISERLIGWVTAQRSRVPETQLPIFDSHLDNLRSVFGVLSVRAAELIDRAGDMNRPRHFRLEHLQANLREAFTAIEKNSFGRYRIAFSPEEQAAGDYLVDLDFRSPNGESMYMPAVFEDVIRDLACNARKYSDPGGSIRVSVQEGDDGRIFLRVNDDGRGIPRDEIENVLSFGHRASSEENRAQTGGGFGLTKAYFVTKNLGGRMWIQSSRGAGTLVMIHLPRQLPGAPPSEKDGIGIFEKNLGIAFSRKPAPHDAAPI